MKPERMTPEGRSDLLGEKEHNRDMASNQEEAAGAAWEGADLERPIVGEDPQS